MSHSYIWPFEGNHYTDVALGENEFDTPELKVRAEPVMQQSVDTLG